MFLQISTQKFGDKVLPLLGQSEMQILHELSVARLADQ